MGKNFKKALSLLIALVMVLGSVAVGGEGLSQVLNAFVVKAFAESGEYTLTVNYVTPSGIDAPASYTGQVYTGETYNVVTPEMEGLTPDLSVVTGVMGEEDLTVTVTYTANSYTVKFMDGNKTVSTKSVKYGQSITRPSNPKKSNWYFAGWSPEVPSSMPADNMVFHATWSKYYVDDVVTFGSYPQTNINSDNYPEIYTALSSMENTLSWVSYGYYVNGSPSNFMKYCDVNYNGEKYRAVIFSSYRPSQASSSNSSSSSSGYLPNTVYWFKWEPLKWYVQRMNGLLKSVDILDTQPVILTDSYTSFASSYLKEWLNVDFYNSAFNSEEKQHIISDDDGIKVNAGGSANSLGTLGPYPKKTDYATSQGLSNQSNCYFYTPGSTSISVNDGGNGSWSGQSGKQLYGIRMIIRIDTLIVSPQDYTVTWIIDGTSSTSTITEGCDIVFPNADIKKNAEFNGWEWKKTDTDTPVEETDVMPSYDVTATATYEEKDYNITFKSNGNVYKEIGFDEGEVISLPEEPTRSGYVFLGWTPSVPDIMPAEDLVVSARWLSTQNTSSIITLGSYPQTKVTDSGTIDALNNLAEGSEWISYGYYLDGEQSDFMKYIDVEYNNVKYRGVTFSSYRQSDNTQSTNGYTVNNIYWFKYEALTWSVKNSTTGLVVCNKAIDSQPYANFIFKGSDPYTNTETTGNKAYADETYEHYATDYTVSNIRRWLNDDFYNTAFSEEEKKTIINSSVMCESEAGTNGPWHYGPVNDKIFIPTSSELATNMKVPTDYSKCQGVGCYTLNSSTYAKLMLREPSDYPYNVYVKCIINSGGTTSGTNVTNIYFGIVPAMRVVPAINNIIEEITPEDLTVDIGEQRRISFSTVPQSYTDTITYQSSNPSIATVDSNGYVTGVSEGKTTVTLTTKTGITGECEVTVLKKNTFTITLDYNGATDAVGVPLENGLIGPKYLNETIDTAPELPAGAKNGDLTFTGWQCEGVDVVFPYLVAGDATFTAVWKNIKTVTWKIDGNIVETVDVEVGERITTIKAADYITAEVGKYITVWTGLPAGNIMPNADIVISCTTEYNIYDVTFADNPNFTVDNTEENEAAATTVTHGEALVLPTALTNVPAGYAFGGWTDGTNTYKNGDVYTPTDKEHGDTLELIPIWNAACSVNFYVNGTLMESLDESDGIVIGEAIGEARVPGYDQYEEEIDYPDGYEIIGWSTSVDSEDNGVEADIVDPVDDMIMPAVDELNFYAVIKAKEYGNRKTVDFNHNEGKNPETIDKVGNQVFDSQIKGPAADPTRKGYEFKGWAEDHNAAEADYTTATLPELTTDLDDDSVTFYAVWEAATIPVEYYVDGALVNRDYVPFDEPYTVETYSAEGIEDVTVWTLGANTINAGTDYTFTEDDWDNKPVKFEATSVKVEYTAIFDPAGGVFADDTETGVRIYYAGDSITAPADPEKEGYDFIGWSEDGENVIDVEETVPDRDIEYIAVWSIKRYSIIFKYGEVNDNAVYKTITEDYGTEIEEVDDPESEGYTFLGWDAQIPETMPAHDTTITAIWLEIEYEYETIYFGSYPQSKVTDEDLIATLNEQEGEWISYKYSSGSGEFYDGQIVASDYMRYKDVSYSGTKYRAVTFDTYRPYLIGYKSSVSANSYQDDNGYTYGNIYWFRYDPLEWRILDEETGLVLCETVIDCQPYNNYIIQNTGITDETYAYFGDADQTYYASDYANSSIRQWLNDDFYNTAFTGEEKGNILTSTLNNEGYYTLIGTVGYEELDSASTQDKVFLLSYDDVKNTAYFGNNKTRYAIGSDYAKCQGIYVSTSDSSIGNSPWRLRSPGYDSHFTCNVDYDGGTYFRGSDHTRGVRPAMNLLNLDTTRYTITFKYGAVNNNAEYKTIKQIAGTAITAPNDPECEGYTFLNWDSQIPGTMPAQDIIITALWTPNEYTITYKLDGVEYFATPYESAVDTFAYGSEVAVRPKAVKEGYTVSDWIFTPALEDGKMPAGDVVANATSSINSYTLTVTYEMSDGKNDLAPETHTEMVEYGKSYSVTSSEVEGYTPNAAKVEGTMGADDVSINVTYSPNAHTVTWNVDGEKTVVDVVYGDEIVKPADPEKEGYTFEGWSEDGENVIDVEETVPDRDIEYIAVWSEVQYKVTYTLDGGKIGDSTEDVEADRLYTERVDANKPADPVKEGYTFAGWVYTYTDTDSNTVTASASDTCIPYDISAAALWTPNEYTVTYKLDGVEYFVTPYESAVDTVVYGTAVPIRSKAVKDGYTVSDWVFTPGLVNGKMPAGDVVANATSSINSYTLTVAYEMSDGKNELAPETHTETVEYGKSYSVTVPEVEGYTPNAAKVEGTMGADDVSTTVTYSPNAHTVTWNVDNEKTVVDVVFGDEIVKPSDPEKEGYTFEGWSEDGENVIDVEETVPDRDIEYIAVWSVNNYKVTYKLDGVEYFATPYESAVDTFAYGSEVTVRPRAVKEGYTVSDWVFTPALVDGKMPAVDVVANATSSINSYNLTVIYTMSDGKNELAPDARTDAVEYGSTYSVTSPEVEGYTPSAAKVEGTMGADDFEVTVTYSPNAHAVTWNVDNEKTVVDVVYGDEIVKPADPEKEGYTFEGWSEDGENVIDVEETVPDRDIEYIAVWSVNNYKVTYKLDGVEYFATPYESAVDTFAYSSEVAVRPKAVKEGHTVSDWTFTPALVEGKMPASDVVANATSSINSYTLTVAYEMSNGKNNLAPETHTETVEYGKSYSVTSPGVEGYTPNAAKVEGTMGADDVSTTVTYSPNAHTVTWNVDNEKTVVDVVFGDEIVKPSDPEKEGYTFEGWSEDGENVIDVEETVPDRDIEYIAVWSVNNYKVTYKLDGAEYFAEPYENAIDTFSYGNEVTVRPKAVKEGHTVSDWTFTPALEDGKMPAGNVVASATSTVNTYTVTWIVNGKSTVDRYEFGAEIIIPENPSIPGKIFIGWSGEIPATMPARNLVFVAAFDAITHTATFVVPDENGSYTDETGTYEVVDTRIFEEGQTAIAEPAVPEKDGFTGIWEDYTLGTTDIVIKAIYTIITTDNTGDIETEKTAEELGGGVVNITLNAYSDAQSILVDGENEPLDIVLVVDQSGSMGEYMDGRENAPVGQRRRDYLVNTATSFVNSVKQNAEETGADHRISIVGFAMGSQGVSGHSAYQNTEVLTTVNNRPVTYNRATNEVYKNSLMSVTDDYDHITAAINNIDADGATAADLGFDMASSVFAQNNSDRKKVIIFLTDGEPTATNTFDSGVANKAITYSKRLKAQGVIVYSIAISDLANPANVSSDFNKFLHATSSNYRYASSIWNLDDGSKDNGYFLSVRDENALQSIFDGIYVRSVAKTLNFGAVTLCDTVRKEFTMTVPQEEAFRENTIRKYGITNSDITVDRRDDGTTYIEVRNLTPYAYYDSTNVMQGWKADISFDVTENENALNAGDYLTNTDEAGVIVGGYTVATFESPTVTISEDRYIVEFLIGDEAYEIREMNFGEEITAPECNYATWTVPEGTTVNSGVVKYYADLGEKDRIVIWHIGEDTITQSYATGEKITAPEVNEEGKTFSGWSPSVESYMGYIDLEYTAVFSEHVHEYKKTASSGLCTEGRNVTYTCSCGESYTETLPACEHKLETTVYETDTATITHIFCTECSYSEDKVLTFKTANTGSFGWWGYPGSTVASFDLHNDVNGGEIHNLDENQYLYIRVPITSLNSASQQAIRQGRTINIIHYLENGGTEKCAYAVEGDYIVVKCTSFSYYVFTTQEVDENVTKASFDCMFEGQHQFSYVYNNDATTDADGTETEVCSHCGATGETRTAEGTKLRPETIHTDLDRDGKCDDCGEDVIQGFTVSGTKVLRGKSLDWTVTTLDCVDTIRLRGTYTTENGTKKTLTYIYKLNQETVNLNITDNEGVRTWNIRMPFTFSADFDDLKIDETWSLSYKNDGLTKWNDFSETKAISVFREECYMNENTSEYEPFTLVSAAGPKNVQLNKFSEITVVTTSDCSKVRISVNGKNATYMASSTNCTATENDDGTTTWVIRYKFTQAGENTYSVSTRGPAWSEATTFTTTVG